MSNNAGFDCLWIIKISHLTFSQLDVNLAKWVMKLLLHSTSAITEAFDLLVSFTSKMGRMTIETFLSISLWEIEKRIKESANHFQTQMELTKRKKGSQRSAKRTMISDAVMSSLSLLAPTLLTAMKQRTKFFLLFSLQNGKNQFSPVPEHDAGDKLFPCALPS